MQVQRRLQTLKKQKPSEKTLVILFLFTLLVALALEIEDAEADQDPTEGIILVMRAALNAVRQAILREIVLKWEALAEIVVQDLLPTEEETAQGTDQETDTEGKRESKTTQAIQEAGKETTEREGLPADLLLATQNDDHSIAIFTQA